MARIYSLLARNYVNTPDDVAPEPPMHRPQRTEKPAAKPQPKPVKHAESKKQIGKSVETMVSGRLGNLTIDVNEILKREVERTAREMLASQTPEIDADIDAAFDSELERLMMPERAARQTIEAALDTERKQTAAAQSKNAELTASLASENEARTRVDQRLNERMAELEKTRLNLGAITSEIAQLNASLAQERRARTTVEAQMKAANVKLAQATQPVPPMADMVFKVNRGWDGKIRSVSAGDVNFNVARDGNGKIEQITLKA